MYMYMYVSYEIVLRSQTKESLAAFYSVVLFIYIFIYLFYLYHGIKISVGYNMCHMEL